MSELVTGEAVALELRPAKLPSRTLALLLDLIVVVLVYVMVTVALVAMTSSMDGAAQVAIAIVTFLLVPVGGPIAVETLSHGRSLGKVACGLRVVRDDGGPIRFRHALVRGAVGVVELLLTFGVVACVASLVSARGRRLGDVFAGTLVVRERVPVRQPGLLPPAPPWLAGRFAGLDLSAVPDGLWLTIRQYLTRMGQLDQQVAGAMAAGLAADLAAHTGAPVPQDVPPVMYLAAVVHERQAREAQRAFVVGGSSSVGAAPVVEGLPVVDRGSSGFPSGAGASGGFAPPSSSSPASASRQSASPAEYAAGSRPEAPAPVFRPPAQNDGPADRPATGFVPPA